MKVVLLAGGLGTRLMEETEVKPKPMVEIGGYPILWHIMKHYAFYGFKDFFIALGYKGEIIKQYFLDYYTLNGNIKIDLKTGELLRYSQKSEDWIIHLTETGLNTLTGSRVRLLKPWLTGESFMVTYGDGVSNVDLNSLLSFHRSHGKLATITAVRPPARFGGLVLENDLVASFTEKPQAGEGWINGGFLVFEPDVFKYLDCDREDISLESEVLEHLAKDGQLAAYRHYDFWQCMDTLRDRRLLESCWASGSAPWKIWN